MIMASTSVSVSLFSAFHDGRDKSFLGEFNDSRTLSPNSSSSLAIKVRFLKPKQSSPMMKRFNQLREKVIALHPQPQVITEFCKAIGVDGKVRQDLIRLAKKNGEKLGFLA